MVTKNVLEILKSRYFAKDKNGNIENWEGLCKRVSSAIANDKKQEEEFFNLMYNLEFLPNSPTLGNAGIGKGNFSACFVLPIEDNMKSIMKAATYAALIHKDGGGTGFSFSAIRPAGSMVGTTRGVASGPISFARVINAVTEEVKQGGVRRGANLGSLSVHHPDILQFIGCKKDLCQLNNFNLSIEITDKFMKSLRDEEEYDIIDPRTNKIYINEKGEKVRFDAKKVFDAIIENAWATGEPGLIFIDTINKTNEYGTVFTTNPCGESPLLSYESCNLGSINLLKCVSSGEFDFVQLEETTRIVTQFLDNVIDMNNYSIPEIEEATKYTRKIGIGIMGLADTFIKMGIEYGSTESYKIASEIMETINTESKIESERLAQLSKPAPVFENKLKSLPRKNLWTTIIAPTGTISIIADASSGCEPLFSIGYERKVIGSKGFTYLNPLFINMCKEHNFELTDEIKEKIYINNSIANIEEIPIEIRKLFKTTFDITPEQHVKMQATLQKYVDGGVSKTINLSNNATPKDVRKSFLLAYELGCKGITVYRDGSRPDQIISSKKEEKKESVTKYRSKITTGTTEKIKTPMGTVYLTINKNKDDDDEPIEVFISIGKSGSDIKSYNEALARLISLSFKYKIPPREIVKQLKGIKGEATIFCDGDKYDSIIDLIGKKLERYVKEDEKIILKIKCPECGGDIQILEGCAKCNCGYSRC